MIKGITVTLHERTQEGVDSLNNPIYAENPVEVKNVLVAPAESDEITDATSLEGKMAVYELCIPKGDTHHWENSRVSFYGEDWQTFGYVREWIQGNVPLSWNKKVKVARYG